MKDIPVNTIILLASKKNPEPGQQNEDTGDPLPEGGSEFSIDEPMAPSCLISMAQAGCGGGPVWGLSHQHTLGPRVPVERSFQAG